MLFSNFFLLLFLFIFFTRESSRGARAPKNLDFQGLYGTGQHSIGLYRTLNGYELSMTFYDNMNYKELIITKKDYDWPRKLA